VALEPMLTMTSSHFLSSLDHVWQHNVLYPHDALDVDQDQDAHQLLAHLVEVARVWIRQSVVALDGVLSASTQATSPSRYLSEARVSRRRQRANVREGTKGGLSWRGKGPGRHGQHTGAGGAGVEGGEDGGCLVWP
jgi:hypothetical protein